ncbi:arylsulfatase [Rubinisphaera sp.]|uniref:sulfatase family protein n=1 Tax=Rubinisphaera sp. TaxID=2024857 RepID=UPI000C0D6C4D|nr:arylsulfatase [Rubinisphaera sp.]MBV10061.1 arylsulfatase [Rubinisphaera sp.]|tara:strand:- start:95 stop:1666 length:1572 start_codon:yes stop_codon:yes gene_type:complete
MKYIPLNDDKKFSEESIRALLITLSVGVLWLFFSPESVPAESVKRPNIIVIMADDLGYGDLSCYGATEIETPNIDRLAREGQLFRQGYCSASTCTPTRFSFLTGMYAFRQPGTGIAPPNATALIQPGTPTIASILDEAGYETAVIGKWHLGLGEGKEPDWNGDLKPGPCEIGFDHCYLLPTTNDRVPQVFVDDHRVVNLDPKDPLWVGNKNPDGQPTGLTHRDTLKMDWSHGHNQTIHNGISRIGFYSGGHAARWRDEDLADKWVSHSAKWIETHKDNPFFLFFSSHDIHVPRMPHERFQKKSKLGYRGDAILELDWQVGEVLTTLDRLDLTEKTLVIFCSDNGPVLDDGYVDGAVTQLGKHTPSGPFRGGKYSAYEGGTCTPFLTRWPGTIPAGESQAIVNTVDLATSMAELVKQPIPKEAFPDSLNVLDALLGKPYSGGRTETVEQGTSALGLRVGDWKLVAYRNKKNNGKTFEKTSEGLYELYQLNQDPGESNNVINKFPEKAQELIKRLEEIKAAPTRN